MNTPGYLVVGHACRDMLPVNGDASNETPGYKLGGTVTYAGRMAHNLGLRTALVTSAAADLALTAALPDLEVYCRPAASSTTFENQYCAGARRQVLHALAERLDLTDVPPGWRGARIVHLAPVANELDVALLGGFPGAFVGVTPQGWLRAWNAHGHVRPYIWPGMADLLQGRDYPPPHALALSIEDVNGDEELIATWAACAQQTLLAVTRGAEGATLYVRGEAHSIPAPRVREVDPTGAGDIFAAAFFVRLQETGDPYKAARFAVRLASISVTRAGMESIPTPTEIEQGRAEMSC